MITAVSSEREPVEQVVVLPEPINGRLVDRLNPGQQFEINEGKASSSLAPLGKSDGSARRRTMSRQRKGGWPVWKTSARTLQGGREEEVTRQRAPQKSKERLR